MGGKTTREQRKSWADRNKEKVRESQRRYKQNNRDKVNARQQAYRAKNGGYGHADHIKRTYGLTQEDYNRMFDEQGGSCAICGVHQSQLKRRLCVDHDHETGEVRGLLCSKCNKTLGLVQDDVKILKKMINYLGGVN